MQLPPGSPTPNFLSTMFTDVNNALNGFIGDFAGNIITDIAPLVSAMLVITLLINGLAVILGRVQQPFMEFIWFWFKTLTITAVALSLPVYQNYIVDVFLTLPDQMITSVIPSSVGSVETGQNGAKAIETMYAAGAYNANLFFQEAGVDVLGLEVDLMSYVNGILVYLGTVLCAFLGAVWLFIAKVVLALMLAVGPIFIVMLVWKPTQNYFFSWLGVVLNTVVVSILVIAVFTIFLAIFNAELAAIQMGEDESNFANAAGMFLMGLISLGVLKVIPDYTTQLTGSAAGAVGTAVASLSKGTINFGKNTATGSVRGAFAGAAATKAYNEARAQNKGRFSSLRSARNQYHLAQQEMKQGYRYSDYYKK